MQMTEHTPGPWVVDYRAMDVMAKSQVDGKGPMKVCDIRGWGYLTGKGHGALGLPQEEAVAIQEANAALIAAAPDMLAALREAEEEMRLTMQMPMMSGQSCPALDRVRAAIAKATGEKSATATDCPTPAELRK